MFDSSRKCNRKSRDGLVNKYMNFRQLWEFAEITTSKFLLVKPSEQVYRFTKPRSVLGMPPGHKGRVRLVFMALLHVHSYIYIQICINTQAQF